MYLNEFISKTIEGWKSIIRENIELIIFIMILSNLKDIFFEDS